jgi:hypothetical protein
MLTSLPQNMNIQLSNHHFNLSIGNEESLTILQIRL